MGKFLDKQGLTKYDSLIKGWAQNKIDEVKSSGSGGVTSWNDLEDKPFGDSVTEIMAETEATASALDDGSLIWEFDYSILPQNTTELTVRFDGTDYNVSGTSLSGMYTLFGNLSMLDMGDDTGEPFAIMIMGGIEMAGFFLLDTNPHIISINAITTKLIDSKYVPKVKNVVYNDGGKYLYKDVALQEKVTLFDLSLAVAENGNVTIALSNGQFVMGYMFPTVIDIIGEYGCAHVPQIYTDDKVAVVYKYYTAEYVEGA